VGATVFAVAHSPAAIATFPAPASSNVAGSFLALRSARVKVVVVSHLSGPRLWEARRRLAMLELDPSVSDPRHRAALDWFASRAGQEVSWPEPLDGMFLVNKAKGIHKPSGLRYALSVRQSMNGPYQDALHWATTGSWYLRYAHEGTDPDYFTNKALRACMTDKIPVGVLVQVKERPEALHRSRQTRRTASSKDSRLQDRYVDKCSSDPCQGPLSARQCAI
jgi:hypothetical protein